MNLGLDDMICANMINRSINNIDCSEFEAAQAVTVPSSLNEMLETISPTSVSNDFLEFNTENGLKIKVNIGSTDVTENDNDSDLGLKLNDDLSLETTTDAFMDLTTISEITASLLITDNERPDRQVFGKELHELTQKVCKAETDSQLLIAAINGYRAPIASIFPIIIILFAGGWSDKKGLRKPCMLFPLIGELLGCVALFISAIFMRQLPMEFGSILEKVLPAMMGGQTLMLMGVYSYLSASTAEEDRTFRFEIEINFLLFI